MENISSLKEKWLKKEIDELTNKGMSKVEISSKLDVKPQYLNSILNGSKGITDSFLDKFILVFQINQFDLAPITKQTQNDSIISFIDKIESQAETIGSLKKEIEVLQDKIQRLEIDVSNSKGEDAPDAGNVIAV